LLFVVPLDLINLKNVIVVISGCVLTGEQFVGDAQIRVT